MKIEHITLGGSAVIRDTADILPITRAKLDAIQMSYESKVITLPALPFKIKITATDRGAAFDVMRGDDIAVTNFCCFEEKHSEEVLGSIHKLADFFNKVGMNVKVIEPVTPQWLYSAVVNPFVLKPDEITIAGEVELYIYEQLYFAWRKNR